MTITATFNTYEEMLEFAASLLKKEAPKMKEAAPAPVTVQKPAETAVEEPPVTEAKTYTMTEVRSFLGNLRKAGKKDAVTALIHDLGYEKFTDIPEDKYGELMERAEEI